MPLPRIFRTSGEGNVLTFDWFDYSAGTGIKRFYPTALSVSGVVVYKLSTTSNFDSCPPLTKSTVDQGEDDVAIDKDFDLYMNEPQRVQGVLYVNATTYQGAAVDDSDIYIKVNVYHVNVSGTETLIGTEMSDRSKHANIYHRWGVRVNLTSTNFVIGETLRVNVQLCGHKDDVGTADVYLYHDPASGYSLTDHDPAGSYPDRTVGSDLVVDVPFKINL